MADEPQHIILEYLRRIDHKVDVLISDVADLKGRVGSLESQAAQIRVDLVRLDHRMDRFDERLSRVERRLEIRPD